MPRLAALLLICLLGPAGSCRIDEPVQEPEPAHLSKYTTVRLTTDLGVLSDRERQMIPILIEAARHMDAVFWEQAYGARDRLLASIEDPDLRRFAKINYGPWDRLDGNRPFLPGVGAKPEGANFYPRDMSREEFEAALETNPDPEALASLYTLVRRDSNGNLRAIPYSQAFAEHFQAAAARLREAAGLARDPGLRRYLELRAEALTSDQYRQSDMAWMEMKDNTIDVVIGPIETYEDQLFGYKSSAEAYVLVKDRAWSERLSRYARLLPSLQRGLPVPEEYRKEKPGTGSELNAYDVLYYAGEANAGSKTIAINLPNDEEVQLSKGTRRLQLKNALRAKFDKILLPISRVLIAFEQRDLITFDAFFANTMFHEVAHGLGIKRTLDGDRTVREALQENASALEEGKADVLGLYMVSELIERGEWGETGLHQNMVTFFASIFRSIRFGASSAHGRANLVRFNFFKQMGAFTRDPETATYRIDFERMARAVDALSEKILRLQGDGDHAQAAAFMEQMSRTDSVLEQDLKRLAASGIPVDIVFEQGPDVLGY